MKESLLSFPDSISSTHPAKSVEIPSLKEFFNKTNQKCWKFVRLSSTRTSTLKQKNLLWKLYKNGWARARYKSSAKYWLLWKKKNVFFPIMIYWQITSWLGSQIRRRFLLTMNTQCLTTLALTWQTTWTKRSLTMITQNHLISVCMKTHPKNKPTKADFCNAMSSPMNARISQLIWKSSKESKKGRRLKKSWVNWNKLWRLEVYFPIWSGHGGQSSWARIPISILTTWPFAKRDTPTTNKYSRLLICDFCYFIPHAFLITGRPSASDSLPVF